MTTRPIRSRSSVRTAIAFGLALSLNTLLLDNGCLAQAASNPTSPPVTTSPNAASGPNATPGSNATAPDQANPPTEPVAPPPPNKPVSERLRIEAEKLLVTTKAPPTSMTITVDGKEIIGFWSPDLSGKPVGAVLMLHDNAESPRSPYTLFRLHRVLPKFGWATLSVQLPSLSGNTIPVRTRPTLPSGPAATPDGAKKGEEAKKETPPAKVDETKVVHQDEEAKNGEKAAEEGSKPSATPPAQSDEEIELSAMATLQAAMDYLQKQKQYNIVILGEGLGAIRALKFASRARLGAPPSYNDDGTLKTAVVDRPIRAMVLLDPDFNAKGAEPPDKLLHFPQIPTLDLITNIDAEDKADAAERALIGKKNLYKIYVSRQAIPLLREIGDNQDDPVTKCIRGFLAQHAKGVVL